MSCIGTAGHIDHGKSTLVKALTGIDPDRLVEEKERGMTIDLGFAWLTLPSGREVSIVDVPGHESFIKNMLAGVGGIDAALLVIAADEGVMPQTREHLAILDLLRVPRGVVALTKADLVDEEWLEMVSEEISELLQSTTLASAPILPVSAYTRQGLAELLAALDRILDESSEREHVGRPRLPVDRVFSMTGFGTVVTGTLLDGSVKVGQEVEILPQGMRTRIRGLQMHKQQIDVALPGNRVAMNLANIARSDVQRGEVVSLPDRLRPTLLFDARIQLLADAERTLSHNMQVDFYSGSQEIPARVRLLDSDELQPGQSAWVQLRLSRAAVVERRDRFILRLPSPSMTIGGGEVLDVHPRYHRRHQPQVLAALELLAQASPEELVMAALDQRSQIRRAGSTRPTFAHAGLELSQLVKQCNLSEDVTLRIVETFLSEGRVRKAAGLWFAQQVWDALTDEAVRLVREHHQHYPLRSGLSKEEWRSRLGLSSKVAAEVFSILQAEGSLDVGMEQVGKSSEASSHAAALIRLPGFVPRFTPAQEKQVDRLLQAFYASPFTPPGRAEAEAVVGPELLAALIEQGRLVKLGDGVLFLRETYEEALHTLVAYIQTHGKLTAAEARDVLGTTRKYILPLLEQMDTLRLTRRLGDERVLGTSVLRSL